MKKIFLVLLFTFFTIINKAYSYDFNDTGLGFMYDNTHYPIVTTVMTNSNADEAGFIIGDVIININGADLFAKNLEEILNKTNKEVISFDVMRIINGKTESVNVKLNMKPVKAFDNYIIVPQNTKIIAKSNTGTFSIGDTVKFTINPKTYKDKEFDWNTLNLKGTQYLEGEITDITQFDSGLYGIKANIYKLTLNQKNYDVSGKLYSKNNDYVNVSVLNNYTLLLTNDVAQSDETISDKELSTAYKLSDSMRDKLHKNHVTFHKSIIKYLGGFKINSPMIDILSYYNKIPTVKTLDFELRFTNFSGTISKNYKNNISVKSVSDFFDSKVTNFKNILKQVTFEDTSKRNMYIPDFIVNVKSIFINQIPFKAELGFKASEGYYFLNKNKAIITPKNNALLYYLDYIILTSENNEEAFNLVKSNKESLYKMYQDKYSKAYVDDCEMKEEHIGNDYYKFDACYQDENMYMIIGFSATNSKKLIIIYKAVEPMEEADKIYKTFINDLNNKNNYKYNINEI